MFGVEKYQFIATAILSMIMLPKVELKAQAILGVSVLLSVLATIFLNQQEFIVTLCIIMLFLKATYLKESGSSSFLILAGFTSMILVESLLGFKINDFFGVPVVWIVMTIGLLASSNSTKLPLLPLFVMAMVVSGEITVSETSLEIMIISGIWVVFELVQRDTKRLLLALSFCSLWLVPTHVWVGIVIALLFLPKIKLVAEDLIFVLSGCLMVLILSMTSTNIWMLLGLSIVFLCYCYKLIDLKNEENYVE